MTGMRELLEERVSTMGLCMDEMTGGGCGRWRAGVGATLGVVVLGLAGCGNDPVGFACTTEARSSVTVTVLDSASGTGRARGATVILRDGAYTDSSVFALDDPLPGDSVFYPTNTFERAGTYTVRVRRPGYALWERQNVRVTSDQCHVVTARVRARLQPL